MNPADPKMSHKHPKIIPYDPKKTPRPVFDGFTLVFGMFFEFDIDPPYDPKTTPRPVFVGFSMVFVCFLSFHRPS